MAFDSVNFFPIAIKIAHKKKKNHLFDRDNLMIFFTVDRRTF